MPVRYLSEADVAATLDVATTVELLDAAARATAAGEAIVLPRQRARLGETSMQVLPAAYLGRFGHKTYVVAPKPRGARFLFTMYAANGELTAIIEANDLGRLRTGAAAGLATRYMARADARHVAIIGSGKQASAQLEAVCAVRPIDRITIYSRNPDHAQHLADTTMALAPDIRLAASAADAVAEADIVCVMTSSTTPVLHGAALRAGTHVNASGSNRLGASEVDLDVVARAAVIAVDDIAQAHVESEALTNAVREERITWEQPIRLADIVAGTRSGRTSDADITFFESLGIGLWDLAAANLVYDRSIAAGRGHDIDIPA